MRLRGTIVGALNLFRVDEGRLDEADLAAAQAFADVATIAILQHRAALEAQVLNEQLNHALNSRVVIEQAKGVLAERAGLDMEEAFHRLRSFARNHNLRLVDVAGDVISGSLESRSPRPVPRLALIAVPPSPDGPQSALPGAALTRSTRAARPPGAVRDRRVGPRREAVVRRCARGGTRNPRPARTAPWSRPAG